MPDSTGQSRVLTLVFTDLADSTALKSERGDAAVRDLILRHRDKVTQLAEECAGRVIDWAGDGCFLTFETSTAGVMFTLRLQQAHADESDLPGVRIGIHLGEITESPGPDNTVRIEGLAVDVAARISGLAKPGQVLMSSAIYNSARQRLGVEAMGMPLLWQLHGTYALKGFDTPLEIGEAAIQGVAALEAPKAGDKAQLVKRAPRQPQQFKQSSSRGVPLWMVSTIVLVFVLVIGGLLLRDTTAPQTTRTATDAPIRSLAVLPFDNLMGDETKEYFVDGMTDTLTAELSKIASIKVIARTSAMKFKDSDETLSEIARQLGVDGLIEGSVQQFEDEIRITAQLIDGRSENHLWGHNFEGTLTGVMKMQGEVAVAIADQIGAVLTPDEREEYASAKDVDPEAYDLYLQGMSIMQGRTEQDLRSAIELFERALEIDPEIALAHAGIGGAHSLMGSYLIGSMDEAKDQAFKHALKATELDPSSAEGYTALAESFLQFEQDQSWSQCLESIQRAVELNPSLTRARYVFGTILLRIGRTSDGLEQLRIAVELAPFDPIVLTGLGDALAASNRFAEAEESYLRAIELNPEFLFPQMRYQVLLWRFGRLEEGLARVQELVESTGSPQARRLLERTNAALQGIDAMRTLVAEKEANEGEEFHYGPLFASLCYAIGDVDKTLEHLQAGISTPGQGALSIRSYTWIHSLEPDPNDWRHLDDDPRFWDMLAEYDLPPLPPEHPRHAKEQAYLRQKAASAALAAQPKPVSRFTIDLPADRPMYFNTATAEEMPRPAIAVSQDGSRLVYAAQTDDTSQLYMRNLDSMDVVPLLGTDGAYYPFFSPDGAWVGYFTPSGLHKVSVRGGAPVHLYAAPNAWGATWAPDNTIIFNALGSIGFWRIHADGTEADEAFTSLNVKKNDQAHNWPSIGPDNRTMYYSVWMSGSVADSRIESISLTDPGDEPRLLLNGGSGPHVTPTGHLVYARADTLLAAAIDPATRLPGTPVALFDGILADNHYKTPQFALSKSGLLVYAAGDPPSNDYDLIWLDREGKATAISDRPGPFRFPDLSPDNKRIVYINATNQNLWVFDLDRGTQTPLTSQANEFLYPTFSPNGKEVSFSSSSGGRFNIFRLNIDGAGELRPVLESGYQRLHSAWTPDGESMVYSETGPQTNDGLWITSVDTRDSGSAFLDESARETTPAISTNGWIAYTSDKTGKPEIFVRRFPSGDGEVQVSRSGGLNPFWSDSGDELFYQSRNNDRLFGLSVDAEDGPGVSRELFETPSIEIWDVDSSGQRFLGVRFPKVSPITKFHVVQNFFEELERLAPH